METKGWSGRFRRGLSLVVVFGCVASCSAEDAGGGARGSSGDGRSDPFDNVPSGPGTGQTPSGGGDFGNPTSGPPTGSGGIVNPTAGTTQADFSYIWIANSAEGTVSKLDTRTMTELGRYRTSANGRGLPSRTTVAPDGNVAVANRTNATGQLGGDGGIMKIFASEDSCTDKNGNGTLDTSTGASDVRNFGEDECVAWFSPMSYFSNRPVAWAPAPAPDAPLKLWTAAAVPPGGAPCGPLACTIDVLRLNGDTGAIEDTITISGLSGMDFVGTNIPFGGVIIENYGPYGGAADAGGNFWTFVSNTTQLIRVDALTLEHAIWPIEPAGNGYGITIDEKGRIFLCGSKGISRFDPATQTWASNTTNVPLLGLNGCMTDGAGKIWVGGGSDFGEAGLHGYDAESLQHVASFPVGAVKGVSVDVDGYVWGVGSPGAFGTAGADGNRAWRVDPMTGDSQVYEGLNGAYSYSDMTGFGLRSAGVLVPVL